MRTGDPVTNEQVTSLGYPRTLHGALVDTAYESLLAAVKPGRALTLPRDADGWPMGVPSLGVALSDRCRLGWPVGFLAHRSVELGWHRDRQCPPNTWNMTILLRPAWTIDWLVIDGEAWGMTHGAYIHFDNQRWHGTFQFNPLDRIALTYYTEAPT